MSRKKITFKMPASEAPQHDDPRWQQAEAAAKEHAPPKALAGEPDAANASTSDQWVHSRTFDRAIERPSAPAKSLLIDVAAERNFHEVLVLILILPQMLSLAWLLHAMNRYRKLFS